MLLDATLDQASEVSVAAMHSPDSFGWVGSIIDGRFAVQAIAGEGGFGTVYRGTHLGLEEPVAIKCFNLPASLSPADQEGFLAKFRAEAQLLHRLSRQTVNIVQALDIGAAISPSGQWTPYIVMEWLEGTTLERDLDTRRKAGEAPRGLDAAIRILDPAAEALGIAHRDNISHRDVKPANLFLWRLNGNTGMKVLDFGIAKVFSETPSLSMALAQTNEGRRALTPGYGAPEQFSLSYGATGPWTDVFAMALVLIEVASGRRALQGETVIDLFMASVEAHQRPDLLEGVTAPNVSVALVLRRALTVNPALRFQTMDALWSALAEARGSAPESLSAAVQSESRLGPPLELPSTVDDCEQGPQCEIDAVQNALSETESAHRTPRSSAAIVEDRVGAAMAVDLSKVAALPSRLDAEAVEDVFGGGQRVVSEQFGLLGGVPIAFQMAPGPLVHLRVVGTSFAYQAEPGVCALSVGRQRRKAGQTAEEGNDVVIRVSGDDTQSMRISRRHFEIVRTRQHYSIIRRSRGNTALNGEPLPADEPVPLRSGDRIGIAGVLLIEFAVRDASRNEIVNGPVDVGARGGNAGEVVMEASVGDMVTVRDD